jgi:hypothetical protein
MTTHSFYDIIQRGKLNQQHFWEPSWLSRYSDQKTGWAIRGSNSGTGSRFPKRPERSLDPSSLLFMDTVVLSTGVKRKRREADNIPSYCAEVKNMWI